MIAGGLLGLIALLLRLAQNRPSAIQRFYSLRAEGKETEAAICALHALVSSVPYPHSQAEFTFAKEMLDWNRQIVQTLKSSVAVFGKGLATLIDEAVMALQKQQYIIDEWTVSHNEQDCTAKRDWADAAVKIADVKYLMLKSLETLRLQEQIKRADLTR